MKRVKAYLIIFKSLGFTKGLCFILCNNFRIEKEFSARFGQHFLYIRSCTNDLYIVHSVLCENEYAEFEHRMLIESDSGLVVDAGGHIGGSVHKLRKLFPLNKIVVVEPEDRNFMLLEKNVTQLENVGLMNAALAPMSKEGNRAFLRDRTGRAGFTIVDRADDNPEASIIQEVPTISLREIMNIEKSKGIAFLKVDVEGAEKIIFASDKEFANFVSVAYIELHDRIVAGCTETVRNYFRDTHVEIPCTGEKLLFVRTDLSSYLMTGST